MGLSQHLMGLSQHWRKYHMSNTKSMIGNNDQHTMTGNSDSKHGKDLEL